MKGYMVKNWDRHQHGRTRAYPWIKFYLDLPRDYEFSTLTDLQKGQWPMLLLVAGRNDGFIPDDPDYIRQFTGFRRTPDLQVFAKIGLLIPYTGNAQTTASEHPADTQATPRQHPDDSQSTHSGNGKPYTTTTYAEKC